MQTSVVDLRYRMKDVLKALTRRERVQILYHGRIKGEIIPAGEPAAVPVTAHPFCGMYCDDVRPVNAVMAELRKGRYRAL
ncbi:MAG: type II toxin-antitoxin system Phd/YefM family antitoxin [Candidatus Omnitrophica bacterium]|nr:type II toxin-antitoxin system Phd/YefM family antitoxin [Candidatus Omnitrophota bacterium]